VFRSPLFYAAANRPPGHFLQSRLTPASYLPPLFFPNPFPFSRSPLSPSLPPLDSGIARFRSSANQPSVCLTQSSGHSQFLLFLPLFPSAALSMCGLSPQLFPDFDFHVLCAAHTSLGLFAQSLLLFRLDFPFYLTPAPPFPIRPQRPPRFLPSPLSFLGGQFLS